ncbi:2Fe-2S iron-sulfur cluster binding domain-containing protein [Nocardioides eburneiflavus]|uniref:2Fe-2S iron-sulfur cluster binding domain-containing protein n=1 Tax=Nocardioides eburneiflavus TaxID=2518372 RepID=A0A4Z1CE66_9ACTN|nr:2Fe-2S iron-sulfur cluster-binding protein [Nocardioides eburneiflavus]TGN63568.1 2Fe-2S iron-sulfur cluster binding domain-containing protein [Nocardioides eburneiflavus]
MNLPQTHARTEADRAVEVNLSINGSDVALALPARVTLSDALRDHLGLTGTHVGCEHGICGMCTVLVDGEAARACLLFAVQLDGAEITTVEGLGKPDQLHPLQESFGRHHGLQCGFCTPGFLMSSYDLLTHEPEVQREDLPTELSGVLCRCTGYRNIVDAVDEVAQAHRGALPGPANCGQRTLVGRTTATAATSAAVGAERTDEEELVERPQEIVLPAGDPTIHVDVTSQLTSAPDEVARVFGDVRLLARCLPGAELTDDLGADWYRGRARIALGPMRMAFNGIAHIEEQSDERIVMKGQGKDTGGGGAQARIVMTAAAADDGGTVLQAEADVFLTGRIAGFGRSLAGDVSRRMFQEFARAVDRAASGEEPTTDAQPPRAFSLLVATIVDRARQRLRRLTSRGESRR